MYKAAKRKQILNYFQVPARNKKKTNKQTNTNKTKYWEKTYGKCVANFENLPNDQWECLCTCI